MLKSLNLRKKIVDFNYYASNPTYDQPLFKLKFYIIKFIHSFIHPFLFTTLTIIQNTIFTFTLDGEELENIPDSNYYEWETTNMFHNFTLTN